MNRREFLQSSLYGSLLYGAGGFPSLVEEAAAGFVPLQNKVLVNLFLSGGPDFRHLIVPAFNSTQNSFGYKYWKHRWRAHDLSSNPSSWQQRWNNDYYPITVGGQNWNSSLVSSGQNSNSGVTFGIWREAGWLIDMFRSGKVALVFNAVGGRDRAHDLSSLKLHQGNVLSGLNNADRSGWGGRVARSAGGNAISVTNTPNAFSFGPVGAAPSYNPNAIDNSDLIAVQNSREMGLNEAGFTQDLRGRANLRMAMALKNYYSALRTENIGITHEKFMDHEQKVRLFGELIRDRLSDLPVPDVIRALYTDNVSINGQPVNPAPGTSNARRVLRNGYSFGAQIRNLFDVLAANDLLGLRTVSMEYGGWDSHGDQRQPVPAGADANDPNVQRGIENGFKDIFGGQIGGNPSDPNAWHSGFSALWQSLNQVDRNKMVLEISGEFGRQIRDNGDAGTDHGKGNLMLVIGEQVTGGIYGEMFPEVEIDQYDDESLNTPDIEPRTDIDFLFSQVSNWVAPGSANSVFPRLTASGLAPEDVPTIESGVSFNNLF